MAKIVDKDEKRKEIALACRELFVYNSIKDLTISKIAQTAGIAKGSFYDYFENKEDVVFELIELLSSQSDARRKKELDKLDSVHEKMRYLFGFFCDEKEADLREIHKSFTAISLTAPNEKIIEFQTKLFIHYKNWMTEILQEGIDKGEISDDILEHSEIFFMLAKGLFISALSTKGVIRFEEKLNGYIDFIFEHIKGNK